jgi:hypothetical protein
VSEIENAQKNLLHASLRFRARVIGSSGAVAGLFTFVDDNNESDIEILTSDAPTTYRFTNQPATKMGEDIPGASRKIDKLLPWDEWRTQRIDWLPGMSRWFIDQKFVAGNTYSVPRKPSGLVLNMWSDGGAWSGNMTVGTSAELQIEWIQVLFNTSGSRDGPGGKRGGGGKSKRWLNDFAEDGFNTVKEKIFTKREAKFCTVICKVDGVETVGYPEVAYLGAPGSAASLSVMMSSWALVMLAGIVVAVGFL